MKNNMTYRLPVWMFLSFVLTLTSCSDWTEVESLKLNTSTFEEQNPQLYADYLKDLIRYKSEEHKVLFVSFENPQDVPAKQAERLTVVPDSVDFICLNNPYVNSDTQAEMVEIRKKGTRTLYSIDYAGFESAWKEKAKENPNLTEEDALQYIDDCTNEMLAICDRYDFDGIVINYAGRSLVSLTETALAEYNARQQKFFGEVMNWRREHESKTLVFYGNVQYLVPENMNMLDKFNYIMVTTASSTSANVVDLKINLAIQAGIDAMEITGETVNQVPNDRFIACVQLPQADDKDKVIGYWNTEDENRENQIAAIGAARWVTQESLNYVREGIFVMNVHNDYYNNTYGHIHEIIRIMNPNR